MDRENICDEVDELLPEYIAGTSSMSEKYLVLAHLAVCSDCRKAAAELIALKNELKISVVCPDVPDDVLSHAFDLLPPEQVKTDAVTHTRGILKKSSNLITDALNITRSTMKLAAQFII